MDIDLDLDLGLSDLGFDLDLGPSGLVVLDPTLTAIQLFPPQLPVILRIAVGMYILYQNLEPISSQDGVEVFYMIIIS